MLLSARRVGPTGKAYGVDFTPEMLKLATSRRASNLTSPRGPVVTADAAPSPSAGLACHADLVEHPGLVIVAVREAQRTLGRDRLSRSTGDDVGPAQA